MVSRPNSKERIETLGHSAIPGMVALIGLVRSDFYHTLRTVLFSLNSGGGYSAGDHWQYKEPHLAGLPTVVHQANGDSTK